MPPDRTSEQGNHVTLITRPKTRPGRWPWIVLALLTVPAVWHVVDFESDTDPEYPLVVRPTLSAYPPAAYRLSEPGDTIDRIGLYLAGIATALSVGGCVLARRRGEPANLWPAATAASLAAFWHMSTPGPTFDNWHGLGWRAILDPEAPTTLRLALAAAGIGLGAVVALSVKSSWGRRSDLWRTGRERGVIGLLATSAVLIALRQVPINVYGPPGYWPRWALVWGLAALIMVLIRVFPPLPATRRARFVPVAGLATVAVAVVAVGLSVVWYHRPIGRFKESVPGKIFICAMPTYRGLEVVQRRHGFKTIINLFPEHTERRSPHFPDEVRFAREHGINYVLSPEDPNESEAFLDRTLAIAQDPDAWPILVHCHGCMDRTPAWLGIYRFLIEGRPLDEIVSQIEQHRGYRPKASVTLLYNHALRKRAPERYLADPTGRQLIANAKDSPTPYDEPRGADEPRIAAERLDNEAGQDESGRTERK